MTKKNINNDSVQNKRIPRSVAIRIMCHNEAPTIGEVVERTLATAAHYDGETVIEVIDDGSSDNSAAIVDLIARNDKRVVLTRHIHNLGIGEVLRYAFRPTSYEAVVLLCADLQFAPEDTFTLVESLQSADLAIARRRTRRDSRFRALITKIDQLLSRILIGHAIADVHWVRAVRSSFLDGLPFIYRSPTVDMELALRVIAGGGKLVHVDLPHYPRKHGRERGGRWGLILRSFLELTQLAWYWRCRQLRGGGN